MLLPVLRQYLGHLSKKNPSKPIFWNSRLSRPFGILIGQTQPEKEADWILKIPCLDRIGLGTEEHTPGFLATLNNRAIAKDIIAPDLI
jgi:hypothetical protein